MFVTFPDKISHSVECWDDGISMQVRVRAEGSDIVLDCVELPHYYYFTIAGVSQLLFHFTRKDRNNN